MPHNFPATPHIDTPSLQRALREYNEQRVAEGLDPVAWDMLPPSEQSKLAMRSVKLKEEVES